MSSQERLHALDAVRGFALLLGVLLHASMPFFLPIPAMDVSQSEALGAMTYVIHIFRMPVFYLLAGFFGHMAFHKKGARGFVADRAKRIGVPMLAGWVLLVPLTVAITIWGLARTFGAEALENAAPTGFALPLTHLWFLYYLCIFYGLVLAARGVFDAMIDRSHRLRRAIDGVMRGVLGTYFAPILLAAPLAVHLYLDPTWIFSGGIPTPDTGLTPKVPAVIGYGTAFAFGWLLHRQIDLLRGWEKRWPVYLAAAAVLTAACLSITSLAPSSSAASLTPGPELFVVPGPAWMRLVYTTAYTTAIWCWTFGVIGAALRFYGEANAVRRYVADSSYWIYLVHLPLVFFLGVVFAKVPWHWSVKYPLILAIAFTVLFASYHYLVRSTFIGEVLNGRKHRRLPLAALFAAEATIAPGKRTYPGDAQSADAFVEDARLAVLGDVSKRYGKTIALDGVNLEVRPGEVFTVLGPNGAGKSTAISLWLGLLEADDGVVRLMGRSPFDVESRRWVGVMMQEVNLAPTLRVRELVDLAASYYARPLPVHEALERTGTTQLADRRYGKLSAGQKRQAQFAMAICGRPRLLFLDEPTVGLDVRARETMWTAIQDLLRGGCSIVLTTHYLEEAEALADRVAVLARGRVIATGSVDEIRSLVSRKRVSCSSDVAIDEVRTWPDVVSVSRDARRLEITAIDAESVVRRLLGADGELRDLEVRQAGLAEAFVELTKEAA